MDDNAEVVRAYRRAITFFLYSARISGAVVLLSGVVGIMQGRFLPLAIFAVVAGVAFSWLGWFTSVKVWMGHTHWSTTDARHRRRFRRAMRKELG